MDQPIAFSVETDKSTVEGVNSLNIDCDLTSQTSSAHLPGIFFKSPQTFGQSRGDFILMPGSAVMTSKKKSSAHPNGDCSALLHGGKKRRENGRSYYSCNATPWIMRNYSPGIFGLHEEIEDFYNYVRPTEEENNMRKHVIQLVQDVVLWLWPNAKIDVFGSFRTELYLPTSDIDMVVFGEWETLPMETLKKELIRKGVAKEDSVKVLDRAAVPIIKFQHIETEVKVDISFNMKSGVQSVNLVKDFLKEFPSLPKLMFVLKQHLLIQELNEVWTGGLSSYSLLLMCVSFLQLHPRCDARSPNNNLGTLLIEFFDLYGRCFNYDRLCIRVKDGGCYITKEEFCQQLDNGSALSLLCIEDPLTKGNDLGRGTYALCRIKQSFFFAYHFLMNALHKQDRNGDYQSPSYLNRIVHVPQDIVDSRRKACEHWRMYISSPPPSATLNEPPHSSNRTSDTPAYIVVSSSEHTTAAPPLTSSEGYSSSSSSTESDLDERYILLPRSIHRAKSCDSLSQNGGRKYHPNHRHLPVRMHSADSRFTFASRQNGAATNLLCFTIDQNARIRGAADTTHDHLSNDDSNRLENRGDSVFERSRSSVTGSTASIRGRPTVARGHSSAVNRKYTFQRPVPVGNSRMFER